MSTWALSSTEDGGSLAKSSEVFTQDPTAEVYEIALGTTGTSNTYGIPGIDAANFEHLQGKYVVASIWMKHTAIADVSGVLIVSSATFSSRTTEMDYGVGVGWQRISVLFLFPTSGTVYFNVGKVEQGSGNIGTVYFTMPIICEVGADFQQIQSRTTQRIGPYTFADSITGSSSIRSTNPTAGIGYSTGAGGTATQATDKTTGVTLSRVSGQITMNGAALAAATTVSFTLTNTAIAVGDVLILNHVSGGTAGSYALNAQCAAGSASINVRNITAGSLSESIVIGFILIKGATS
jgi:hypothetical protein